MHVERLTYTQCRVAADKDHSIIKAVILRPNYRSQAACKMKRRLSLLRCSLAFSSLSFRCCVQQIVEGEHHARTVTVQRRSGRPAGIAYLLSLVFRAVQRSNAEGTI